MPTVAGRARRLIAGLVVVATAPVAVTAQAPPRDGGMTFELRQLRDLSALPRYRPGSVVAQESSYDRTGGNDDGFRGTWSSIRREGGYRVLADLEGPGVVDRIWTPTPTETPVAFYFDGESEPRLRLPFTDLFSGEAPPFVRPLVGNEVGGYYSYLPIPYARSLRIVYEGEDIRFHQIQYRRYPEGTEVESLRLPLDDEATRELRRAAGVWESAGERPAWAGPVATLERPISIGPGGAPLRERLGPGRIVGLEMERAPGLAEWPRGAILSITWDDEAEPGVLAPVADLFGHAFGRPAAHGLLVGSRGRTDYLYLPMPFDRSARVELRNDPSSDGPALGTLRVFHNGVARDPASEGKLYAAWRREIDPPEGEPYLILETDGRGHFVGTTLQAQGLEPGMTTFFEGDDVATVDGEMRLHGTGSEDYFNGGWYALLDRWNDGVSLPLHGALAYSLPLARTGGYRFYMADKLSFAHDFRLTIEHGPEGNTVPVDYTSVAFYYGEQPPAGRTDLSLARQPRRSPSVHELFPQLLEVSLGPGTVLDYTHRPYLEVRAKERGLLRIDVSELPPGRYRVLLSYERGPAGAEFSIWRRQTRVSDWIDSRAAEAEHVARATMGEVTLTEQVRSLTIRTRASREDGHRFRFDRVVLEELEPTSLASSSGRSPEPLRTTYGGDGVDVGNEVLALDDGGFAIIGYTSSLGAGGEDIYLIRTDATGNALWTRTYGGPGDDDGWDIVQRPDGGFVVAGFGNSEGAGDDDILLLGTDAHGRLEWRRTFGGAQAERSWGLASMPDDGYVIAGQTRSRGAGDWDALVIRTDATGNSLWSTVFGGPGIERALNVAVTPLGRIAVTGFRTDSPDSDRDGFVALLSPGGEVLWRRTLGGDGDEVGHGIAVRPDGTILVTGYGDSTTAGDNDVVLWSLDPESGDVLWRRTLGTANVDDRAMMTALAPDGTLVTLGYLHRATGDWDVSMWRTRNDGVLLSHVALPNPGDDRGVSAIVEESGDVVWTGAWAAGSGAAPDVILARETLPEADARGTPSGTHRHQSEGG